MLPDLSDGAEVHEKGAKIFVRNIVIEAIRALLTPLLLTGWRPNEHPAEKWKCQKPPKMTRRMDCDRVHFKFK